MDIQIKKLIVGPVRTNCYIVYVKGNTEAVVVDPGDDAFHIENILMEKKLNLTGILLTHGHCDHIGAVQTLKNHYGATIYAYRDEKEVLTSDYNLSRAIMGERISVQADQYLTDGFILKIAGMKFKLIHTPGHTVGSCCYLMEDEKILFSGDTLFYHSHGRTDFPTGSQSAIIRSIVDKLMVLDDEVLVCPGHEGETTIGSERMIYDIH